MKNVRFPTGEPDIFTAATTGGGGASISVLTDEHAEQHDNAQTDEGVTQLEQAPGLEGVFDREVEIALEEPEGGIVDVGEGCWNPRRWQVPAGRDSRR